MLSKKYIIAIVFLVVVGGVAVLTWSGGTGPTDTTPEDNETYGLNGSGYTTGDLPRGVTVDGISPSPLATEYEEKLSQSTFTLTTRSSEVVDGDTRSVRTVYQKGENAIYVEKSASGDLIREEYYDRENGTLHICDRTVSEECPTSASATQSIPAFETASIKAILVGGGWQPQDVNENAPYTETSLRAQALKTPEPLEDTFYISNVTSFAGNATVDERQVITEMSISVNGDLRGQATDFEYSSTVAALNQTTVSRPNWVSSSTNQTPTANAGVLDDQRTVFVKNAKGATYEAGSTVEVSIDHGQTYEKVEMTLDDEFTEGETLYITLVDGEVRAYQDEAPDQRGDELTAEAYVVRVNSPDGTPGTTVVEVAPRGN